MKSCRDDKPSLSVPHPLPQTYGAVLCLSLCMMPFSPWREENHRKGWVILTMNMEGIRYLIQKIKTNWCMFVAVFLLKVIFWNMHKISNWKIISKDQHKWQYFRNFMNKLSISGTVVICNAVNMSVHILSFYFSFFYIDLPKKCPPGFNYVLWCWVAAVGQF